jgi:hypothetical protein
MRMILLKNPSGQKVTVKKTISDVSPGNSNRVQTKLTRKNSRQFSCIFTHLQKGGVLQQNRECHIGHPPRQPGLRLDPDGDRPNMANRLIPHAHSSARKRPGTQLSIMPNGCPPASDFWLPPLTSRGVWGEHPIAQFFT